MMQMTFYFGTHAVVLFEGWKVESVGVLILSCIAIMLLGVLKVWLQRKRRELMKQAVHATPETQRMLLVRSEAGGSFQGALFRRPPLSNVALTTAMLFVSTTLSGGLMLGTFVLRPGEARGYVHLMSPMWSAPVLMTYNVALFFAVVLGEVIGHAVLDYADADVMQSRGRQMSQGDICH